MSESLGVRVRTSDGERHVYPSATAYEWSTGSGYLAVQTENEIIATYAPGAWAYAQMPGAEYTVE